MIFNIFNSQQATEKDITDIQQQLAATANDPNLTVCCEQFWPRCPNCSKLFDYDPNDGTKMYHCKTCKLGKWKVKNEKCNTDRNSKHND